MQNKTFRHPFGFVLEADLKLNICYLSKCSIIKTMFKIFVICYTYAYIDKIFADIVHSYSIKFSERNCSLFASFVYYHQPFHRKI